MPAVAQAATTGSPWRRNGPTQLRRSLQRRERSAREEGSEASAARMGTAGGGEGAAAHRSAATILSGERPARARVWRGEEGARRNLRASRMTYLPV